MKGIRTTGAVSLALCALSAPFAFSQDVAPFVPPACVAGQEMFSDVPASNPFCPWIEQLVRDHITGGCGPQLYCPTAPVSRAQMSVFLELAMRGTDTWTVDADLLDGMDSTDFVTGVAAGAGLTGGGSGGSVTLALADSFRLPQSCGGGQHPMWTGTGWDCGNPGTGTVTSVGAGAGLTGGPITSSGTISVAPGGITGAMIGDGAVSSTHLANGTVTAADVDSSAVQLRVGETCADGSSIRLVNANGTVACEPDDVGAYDAGTGLILSGSTFSVDMAVVASRVHNHMGAAWSGSVPGVAFSVSNMDGSALEGGTAHTSGRGVTGYASAATGLTRGLYGVSLSSGGAGVEGQAGSSTGNATGVYGVSYSEYGIGVHGEAAHGTGATVGVYGRNVAPTGYGVQGLASAESGNAVGVYGQSNSASGYGVQGVAAAPSGTTYGVYGLSASTNGYGVYSFGAAHVTGNLTVSGTKSFKIDHPLDPANRYLVHAAIESDEMLNMYSGTALLDGAGRAAVELPDWFEALNRDFRYQLTCVGGYAPVYVASEIRSGRFEIAGGTPGLKVSWMVVGTRSDAYALAHPMAVEQDKPAAERGTYLHPEVHGQPVERGRDYPMRPAAKRQ